MEAPVDAYESLSHALELVDLRVHSTRRNGQAIRRGRQVVPMDCQAADDLGLFLRQHEGTNRASGVISTAACAVLRSLGSWKH